MHAGSYHTVGYYTVGYKTALECSSLSSQRMAQMQEEILINRVWDHPELEVLNPIETIGLKVVT